MISLQLIHDDPVAT